MPTIIIVCFVIGVALIVYRATYRYRVFKKHEEKLHSEELRSQILDAEASAALLKSDNDTLETEIKNVSNEGK